MSDPIVDVIVMFMTQAAKYAMLIGLASAGIRVMINAATGKERFI